MEQEAAKQPKRREIMKNFREASNIVLNFLNRVADKWLLTLLFLVVFFSQQTDAVEKAWYFILGAIVQGMVSRRSSTQQAFVADTFKTQNLNVQATDKEDEK